MRKVTGLLICFVALQACAETPVERSKATMDSGAALSAAAGAYSITHYTLRNDILVDQKAIAGSGEITIAARSLLDVLELDFDGLLIVDRVSDTQGDLEFTRTDAKIFVSLRKQLASGESDTVKIEYHGVPREAIRAPWDGGFVWETSPSGKPWIATALQGEGCDLWWPCKDHVDGEPASMDLYFTVPTGLTVASNGVLIDVVEQDGRSTFHWQTKVPTNTYGVAVNIGDFVLIEQDYESVNGTTIPIRIWVLRENEDRARAFFEREFEDTLEFFERMLGPYPWGQEKLGIVETPHYGMEHQTINAYGRDYKRITYGFDYILNHELAHEWFGNLMTHASPSDLWLHEGFGTFMQPEYTRQHSGEAAYHALFYENDLRISACNPVAPRDYLTLAELYFDGEGGIGPAGDIYGKGSAALRSLEYVIGEDALWRAIRRLLYDTAEPWNLQPPIQPVLRSTDDFVRIVSEEAGSDLAWFFEVYLRRGPLPEVVLSESGDDLIVDWISPDDLDFPMPLPIRIRGVQQRLDFTDGAVLLPDTDRRDVLVDPLRQILRKTEEVPTCEERKAEAAS
ncbi:MAG: M1 family metallopeptidase [Woeseiaceae bacterium]